MIKMANKSEGIDFDENKISEIIDRTLLNKDKIREIAEKTIDYLDYLCTRDEEMEEISTFFELVVMKYMFELSRGACVIHGCYSKNLEKWVDRMVKKDLKLYKEGLDEESDQNGK